MEHGPGDGVDVLVHMDETSFGIYPFPHHAVEVSSDEAARSTRPTVMRGGRLRDNQLTLSKPPFELRPNVRITTQKKDKLYAAFATSAAAAPLILAENAHGLWLNRFRWKSDVEPIRSSNEAVINLSRLLNERRPLREDLFHHGESLQSKLWAMVYHRTNFAEALGKAKTEEPKALHLTRATAEFNAHGSAIYGILDEIAELIALVHKIQTGCDQPRSFHDLYDGRQSLDAPLRAILGSCDWYEEFRLRRANATHGFNCIAGQAIDDDDIALFQRPHFRFSSTGSTAPALKENAETLFNRVALGFDRFLERCAAYALSRAHDFDIASFSFRSPQEGEMEEVAVWMKSLRFDAKMASATDSWVMLDAKLKTPVFAVGRASGTT